MGLKAALQDARAQAPCVVSVLAAGAESAEEEIIASVAGMGQGGGGDALSLNSMQVRACKS